MFHPTHSSSSRSVLLICALSTVAWSAQDFGQVMINSHSSSVQTVNVPVSNVSSTPAVSLQFGVDYKISGAVCGASSCSVSVTFSPTLPGLRPDALVAKDASGKLLGRTLLRGVGLGPQVSFLKAATSRFLNVPGSSPFDLQLDPAGNLYFLSDTPGDPDGSIEKVDASTGAVSVVAHEGLGQAVRLALDGAGNLYTSDPFGNVVRKVDGATGAITVVAGTGGGGDFGDGGPATMAGVHNPVALCVDADGNLYIGNLVHVRRVDAATGIISTVAGNGGFLQPPGDGGPATAASVDAEASLAVDNSGNLFIADGFARTIRKVDAKTGIISAVAGGGSAPGEGLATQVSIDIPWAIALNAAGNLYILGEDHLYKVSQKSGELRIIPEPVYTPSGIAWSPRGDLYVSDSDGGRIAVMDGAAPLDLGIAAVASPGATTPETIENSGDQPLTFSALAASPNFAIISGNNACSVAAPLAPGDSCDVPLAVNPEAIGLIAGSLQITDNDLNLPGSQQLVALTGIGESFAVSPASLTFSAPGLLSPQTVTVTNGLMGPSALNIFISGPDITARSFYETNTCPSSLASGASCTISVNYIPSFLGSSDGMLNIGKDAIGNPVVIGLDGYSDDSSKVCEASLSTPTNPVLSPSYLVSIPIVASAACPFQIRVGGTAGALFTQTGSDGGASLTVSTGLWVSNGLSFYMQKYGDTTAAGTLAMLRAGVENCTVNAFSAAPIAFSGSAATGITTITADASCYYDIRVGGPSGPLFASLVGPNAVVTGQWATEEMLFFLQASGDTTPSGTLALVLAR